MKTFTHEQPIEEMWIEQCVLTTNSQGWAFNPHLTASEVVRWQGVAGGGTVGVFHPLDYQDALMRLSMPEGGSIGGALVDTYVEPGMGGTRNFPRDLGDTVHFTVRVVGFQDDGAPSRNWGMRLE